MATVEEGLQAQIRNIEATYGKPIDEWLAIIAASGLTKHTEVVGMLKSEHGLAHGAAHRISLQYREQAASPPPADPADGIFTGKKAALRPLHEQLMTVIGGFGGDVEAVPLLGHMAQFEPNADVRREAEWTLRGWADDAKAKERAERAKAALRTIEEARGTQEAG